MSEDLQSILDRLGREDDSAVGDLIVISKQHFESLARRMLRQYPIVRQFEETDDIFQNAMIRFDRALRAVRPQTELDFHRLASAQLRRELIDMARHYQGPLGAANHLERQIDPLDPGSDFGSPRDRDPSDATNNPIDLNAWTEFHEQVQKLPDQDRELMDLFWYNNCSKDEAAALLGISVREVYRRFVQTKQKLSKVVDATLLDQGLDHHQ